MACALFNLTSVPLYSTLTPQQIGDILHQAEVTLIICSPHTRDLISQLLSQSPGKYNLKYIITVEDISSPSNQAGVKHLTFSKVVEMGGREGEGRKIELPKVEEGGLFTIMYTSGSTGVPKGAMIKEKAWLYRVSLILPEVQPMVWLSFQPPAHLLDRRMTWYTFLWGGQIGVHYSEGGDMVRLFDDFQSLRPTRLIATPRLWNIIYSNFLDSLEHERKLHAHDDPSTLRSRVLSEYRERLGGRLTSITSSGASVSPSILRFLRECFQCKVRDTYGSTELDGVISGGRLSPDTEFKLVDVPELSYFTTDKPNPRGEIYLKSDRMFSGYYRDAAATSTVFTPDGWFTTGDIGEKDSSSGIVSIIDRKKNVIKLSQGEFVALEKLEEEYGNSKYFDSLFIYANPLWSFVSAVVVPSQLFYLRRLQSSSSSSPSSNQPISEENINEETMKKICEDPDSSRLVLKELVGIGLTNSFKSYEIPRIVLLHPHPFTVANQLLTSSGKRNRIALNKQFGEQLNAMVEKITEQSYEDTPMEGRSIREQVAILSARAIGGTAAIGFDNSDDQLELSLREMGCDSLAAARLVGILEQKFSLSLPVEKLLSDKATITNISKIIETGNLDLLEVDDEEAILSTLLSDSSSLPPSFISSSSTIPSSPSHILLTGVTGFLGSHLLVELLKQTTAKKITCLIRVPPSDTNPSAPMQRLIRSLRSANIRLNKEDLSRVTAISSDLTSSRLGLANDQWGELSRSVDCIYHCGAYVNHLLPYSALKDSNVKSTISIIELAITDQPKQLHFISTIGVVSPDMMNEKGVIDEKAKLGTSILAKANGYSQSKWVAEKLVEEITKRGLVGTTISRPAFISGDTESGHCNPEDTICRLLRGMSETGLAPQETSSRPIFMDLSPVNYVAAAIVFASQKAAKLSSPSPTVLHPIHPNNLISITSFIEALQLSGYPLQVVPFRDWKKHLSETENSFQPLVNRFSGSQYQFTALIDRSIFYSLLEGSNLNNSEVVSVKLIQKYVQFMIKNKSMNPPLNNSKL